MGLITIAWIFIFNPLIFLFLKSIFLVFSAFFSPLFFYFPPIVSTLTETLFHPFLYFLYSFSFLGLP